VGEPTPAKHTQGGEGPLPKGALPEYDRAATKGRGKAHKQGACYTVAYNSAGVCMIVIGDAYGHIDDFVEALRTITGWDITNAEVQKTGERIQAIRQAFNIREGLTTPWKFPDRMIGKPPKTVGPRAGATLNPPDLTNEYFTELGWDPQTGKPGKAKLEELGLGNVAKVLYK